VTSDTEMKIGRKNMPSAFAMSHLLVIWPSWRRLSCPRGHVKRLRGDGYQGKAT
jgi:hypothetical protein